MGGMFGESKFEVLEKVPEERRAKAILIRLPLSAEQRANLLACFKEVLANILKHAGATRVEFRGRVVDREFRLEITDNGRGFDAKTTDASIVHRSADLGGRGLGNLRTRMAAVGGRVEIRSTSGRGTTVIFVMPLEAE